ncbi:hypothetical protein C8R41DRAFT_834671 [Lentinula lateritia]|uniref:F-box domain-containing protein n=1 Tax=Lentinula lateritia TaxID=40482 RepID=A0ABQ8VDW9_9AGAR|nr:hypothetical protein C8R41DRAFT_834671 [Lentinula lateritia]
MSLISVRHMGLKRELPLELLYNVIDICAQNASFNELKSLSLVSRSLNRQARKHIWGHIELPTRRAIRLDREGKDFSSLVDVLSTLQDIPRSLHLVSYPPEVLSPFLRKLKFHALQRISIHGYDPRVSSAPSPTTLAKLLRTNPALHLMKLSNVRMRPISFLDLISQSELQGLRHCILDIINTTVDDSWDDYLREPESDAIDDFLEKRSEGQDVARPSLVSLYLNRVTNLPNPAFCKALFGDVHSLFDISSLQQLTLCISSYPPVPLKYFTEVIELCCLSVSSLTIHNWQDVTRPDSHSVTKFVNATNVAFDIYGGTGLEIVESSLELALEHLVGLKYLKKVKFIVESYNPLEFLPKHKDGLDELCSAVPGIEEIVISIRSVNAECYNVEQVFTWDKDRCILMLDELDKCGRE